MYEQGILFISGIIGLKKAVVTGREQSYPHDSLVRAGLIKIRIGN